MRIRRHVETKPDDGARPLIGNIVNKKVANLNAPAPRTPDGTATRWWWIPPGFNDKTWLAGHPHTDALRVTERFHRANIGHTDLQIRQRDPDLSTRHRRVCRAVSLAAFDSLQDSRSTYALCAYSRRQTLPPRCSMR
jgi:hypothetical protein